MKGILFPARSVTNMLTIIQTAIRHNNINMLTANIRSKVLRVKDRNFCDVNRPLPFRLNCAHKTQIEGEEQKQETSTRSATGNKIFQQPAGWH